MLPANISQPNPEGMNRGPDAGTHCRLLTKPKEMGLGGSRRMCPVQISRPDPDGSPCETK